MDKLSLELMTIPVNTAGARTLHSDTVKVDSVAQVKIGSDEVSITSAAERFLSKSQDEIAHAAHETLLGHLRTTLCMLPTEQAHQDWNTLAHQVQEAATPDLQNMGLIIDSYVIQDIHSNP